MEMMEAPQNSSAAADELTNSNDNQTHEAEVQLDSKISSKRILKLNANVKNFQLSSKKEDLSILHVEECKNLEDAQRIIQNLNFQNAPNIFVIVVETKNENSRAIEKLQGAINGKFKENHPIALQISCGNSKSFYIKKNDKFKRLNLNLARESLTEQIQQSTFTVESFFNILKLKSCSLVDANLYEINEFLKLSQDDHKLYTLALEQRDELCFRLLKLFNVNFSQEIQAEILNSAISGYNFDLFLAYFNKFSFDDVKEAEIEHILALKFNENSKNIFLTSVECKNMEIIKLLLRFINNFKHFFNFKLWKTSWELALNREYFEVCNELQNANFTFTKDERKVKDSAVAKYARILVEISNFHENISLGNLVEVKSFAENHPNLRLCYGNRKTCALEWSIECKRIEIFAFLRSKGFYTDKCEQLWSKIEQLTENQRRSIRDENLKYTISDPDAFIGILLSKCSFDASSSLHFDEIRQMIADLSKIKQIRAVMEIVALSDVKIVFDFKTKSVRTMDPTRDEHYMGIAYYEKGVLYVGRNFNKNQLYGTFAHEMTHYALYLVFENKCLPYWKGDNMRETKWLDVVEEMKQIYENNPEGTDNIIKWVFVCYNPGYQQNAEAIVRVNDLLAFYFDNPAKIQAVRSVFFRLFDFYDSLVLPDLDPESFRLKNLNKEFGLLSKTLANPLQLDLCSKVLIHSNVPHLSIVKLQDDLQQKSSNSFAFRFENIFVTLKDFCEMNKANENLLMSVKVKRIVIDASECSADDLTRVSNKLRSGVEYFVVACKNSSLSLPGFQNISEVFEWHNLDNKSKRYLMAKTIRFQGKQKTFSSLLPEADITSEVLSELYRNEEISINCHNSKASNKVFIQRKLQKKQEISELSLDDFIKLLQNQNKMLISDIAGSGKTFVLDEMRQKLIAKFSNSFVVFANFPDFSVDLINGEFKDFQSFVCEKILKLKSRLDVAVFNHFYTENRVTVLLDGFDEISQIAKEKAIKLIKLHHHGKLLVTTRDYFEKELETSMNVTAFRLIPYTSEDQSQFIVKYWERNKKFNNELIMKCADLLISRLNMILSSSAVNFLGLPLILHIFVEFFKSKLSDTFDKELNQRMKISHAYDELVKSQTNIWSSISNLEVNKLNFNSITLKFLYSYFALKQFVENETNDHFGINYVSNEWNLEEIAKAGIIRIDQDGKVRFIHETVAEYFVSDFIKTHLMHIKAEWKYLDEFVELLVQILTIERFKIVRFFLNEAIHEVKTSSDGFKYFKTKIENILTEDQNAKGIFLKFNNEESTFNLALFFLSSVSSLNVGEIFSSFISDKTKKSPADIDFFFSHIFKLNKEILMKVFLSPDANGFPCFYRLFLCFHGQVLTKFDEKNFTKEEKFKMFLHQSENGDNILLFVIKEVENERVEEVIEVLKNNLDHSSLRSMMFSNDKEGKNVLHSLMQNGDNKCLTAFKFAFDFLEDSMLNEVHEMGKNLIDSLAGEKNLCEKLLQHALRNNKNEKICTFLIKIIKKHFKEEQIEGILTSRDENVRSVLCNAILTDNSAIFKMFFTFYEQVLPRKTFIGVLKNCEGNKSCLDVAKESKIYEIVEEVMRKFLIILNPIETQQKIAKITDAQSFKWIANLNQVWERMSEENFLIEREDFKMFLKAENYKTVVLLAFDEDSYEFMWEILELTFSCQEIKDFLNTTDDYRNNFLHFAAFQPNSKKFFEFAWMKIVKLIGDKEKVKEFLLVKGYLERNALLQSIACQNEKSFYFLFEDVFCKFFNNNDFAFESDENGDNFLHFLARFGSVSMLEFALQKLKIEFSPEEFQKFIKLESKTGQNILHCAALQNESEESVEFLVDFIENEVGNEDVKKMLTKFDKFNCLPLYYATESTNLKVFEFYFSLYEQKFSQVQILQFVREKYKTSDNFLHRAASFSKSNEVFEFAWMKVVNLIENIEELKDFLLLKDRFGSNALLLSIACQNENTFYFLFEEVFCTVFNIKDFAYETDEDGENLLHYLARFGSVSMLEFASLKLKNEFSPEDFQNFIKLKTKKNENLLHCAALKNKSEISVEFLVNFVEDEVGLEEAKKMLSKLDNFNRYPLHCSVVCNNLRTFEYFFSLYEKYFSKTEITNFCEKVENMHSQNIFELARDHADIEMFEAVKQKFAPRN